MTEERIWEFKDKAIEITQAEEQRNTGKKKKTQGFVEQ